MFLFIGVVMAAVQGGYVRRIAPGKEKARHISILVIYIIIIILITIMKAMALRGLLLIVPSFAVVGFAYSLPMLYLGLFLYAVSTAIWDVKLPHTKHYFWTNKNNFVNSFSKSFILKKCNLEEPWHFLSIPAGIRLTHQVW